MTDYSTTFIYKITCKNPNITDVYVGHTVDFIKRRYAHKQTSKNEDNKIKLYETIRANGGWNNWKMEIVHHFCCANADEARIKEQEYYVLLKANLNSVEPHRTHELIEKIKKCNYSKNTKTNNTTQVIIYSFFCKDAKTDYVHFDYTRNLNKIKYFHKQNSINHLGPLYVIIRDNGGWDNWEIKIHETCDEKDVYVKICEYKSNYRNTNKNKEIYNCDVCVFSCSKKSEYTRHCNSIKHKRCLPASNENVILSNIVKEIILSNQEHNNIQQQMMQEIVKNSQMLQQQIAELYNKPQQISQQQNT